MKISHSKRSKKTPAGLRSNHYSLSNAKTYLGRLAEKARQGEEVYIVRGQHRFILQFVPPIDPVPMRPPGYFADAYDVEDSRELNRLAKVSVARPPSDLE